MAALKRIGHNVQRVVFLMKHNQMGSLDQLGAAMDTRIPYASGREYEMELAEGHGGAENGSLVWTVTEHLNPVPVIIELRTSGGSNRDTSTDTNKQHTTTSPPRARVNIPTEKTGGLPDTSRYGPLFRTAISVQPFADFFSCTPNVTSLVIQTPGNDFHWEYTCVDIALESLRLGAATAGIKLQELACLPVHILGLESLCSTGRRVDVVPASFGFLGWGGLRRVELAVNARMLFAGGEVAGRNKLVYGRIVRSFLLALGRMGRNGLETLKFQWSGGENGSSSDVLDCPFFINHTINNNTTYNDPIVSSTGTYQDSTMSTPQIDDGQEEEDSTICASLVFPNLTRLYVRNVATTSWALTNFFTQQAKKCCFVSARMVLCKDKENRPHAMHGFQTIWETITDAEEGREFSYNEGHCIFNGDYGRSM